MAVVSGDKMKLNPGNYSLECQKLISRAKLLYLQKQEVKYIMATVKYIFFHVHFKWSKQCSTHVVTRITLSQVVGKNLTSPALLVLLFFISGVCYCLAVC